MSELSQQKIVDNKARIIKLLIKANKVGIENLIEYLQDTDYFMAPASTKYHGASDGFLAEHSLNVYDLLKEKNERYKLGLSESNITISTLLHDVCKINVYEKKKKENNSFEYVYNDKLPLGHGEKSVIIVEKYIDLENIEMMLIRWHMGMWEEGTNIRTIGNAMKLYPAIAAMQCADMEASRYLE